MKFISKGERSLYTSPFLDFRVADYLILGKEKKKEWFFTQRPENQTVVFMIPFFKEEREVLLLRQFRIPFWKYIIEFPAGLTEKEELPSLTASRELKEETGYQGNILYESPLFALSPGISKEVGSYCIIQVMGEPSFKELEETEDIEVFRVKIEDMESFLEKQREQGDMIDSKVLLYPLLFKYMKEA